MRGVEDYLQQIKRLEEDGQRCTATLLAQTLGVSLPSASEMLKRLAEEGYLERHRDGSIHLTAYGRPLAHTILRRHRLVERLLTDILGMPWHEVHTDAHRLEHAISSRVEEHLAAALGFPEYCPHGHPICPVDRRQLRSLDSVEEGEELGVAQISEVKEGLLAYLDQIGLRPGTIVKVVEVAPFGGPLTLEAESGRVTLPREVAAYVQMCRPEEADWISRRAAG
ncbi:MAG: metal-dependent transcriptional regulator [Candidatus Methylomirabilales bacterium]